MDWFKKHTDAVIVITAIIGCMLWMNGKFDRLEAHVIQDIHNAHMATLEGDLRVISCIADLIEDAK